MSDTPDIEVHEKALNNIIGALNAQQQQLDDLKGMIETLYQAGLALEQRVADLEDCLAPKPRMN